ncbi:MAG: glycosyltransferase family 39 protein [Proteobacteria bacterium]|nr:glycosyltransferase family 39 protein [Pseudomonadota bacterium]
MSLIAKRPLQDDAVVLSPRVAEAIALLALVVASAGMMLTAPVAGDFWWSDAPRHALNGAFVMDLIHDHPFGHATAWAIDYYIRYPALTIIFYPPFFYFVEAILFALFGVSHVVAQFTETIFVFLLAVGAYAFARQWLPRIAAVGVALLTIGTPEIAYWGRQVMLDVPAYALSFVAIVFVCAYLRDAQPKFVYLAAAFFVASIYTKYNFAFLLLPAVAAVWMARGFRVLLDRHVLTALGAAFIALLPAAYMFIRFGAINVDAVAGQPGDMAKDTFASWSFYAYQMPHQLGYPIVALAILGLPLALSGRLSVRLEPWAWTMLAVWFLGGYAFVSMIAHKELRHDLMILFPVILLAALAAVSLIRHNIAGPATVLLVGIATYGYSLFWYPPRVVSGYREVARYVVDHAPPNGVVVFSGYRDGNFAFATREYSKRKDLKVLRATKLLLKIAVTRSFGVEQADLDEPAILQMIKDHGVSMIVAQRNFWQDLREMARFEKVLQSADFQRVASFSIRGQLEKDDGPDAQGVGTVDVFVPTYKIAKQKAPITLDLPIIGATITEQPGQVR